jgi:recombination protein U
MIFKYPLGIKKSFPKKTTKTIQTKTSFKNRGMGLEGELNLSNAFYNEEGMALIQKRPTPINFEKQSTTDYNGVYRSKYLDFEAKSTLSRTSLPISNITSHQITHLKNVMKHGGIAFFIIAFETLQQTYLLPAQPFIKFIETEKRQSLPLNWIKQNGVLINVSFKPRLHFLQAVDQLFF